MVCGVGGHVFTVRGGAGVDATGDGGVLFTGD